MKFKVNVLPDDPVTLERFKSYMEQMIEDYNASKPDRLDETRSRELPCRVKSDRGEFGR